jgi:hypothetical protein
MRVAEVLPGFAQELEGLLFASGHQELAASCASLEFVAPCGCGDDFCAGFYTVPKPNGPWGAGHRSLLLSPVSGMVVVDIVDGRITFVEVLDRQDVRDTMDAAMRAVGK